MPISLDNYVAITSGVGAVNALPGRAFIARIFTTNPLLPTKSYKEFASAAEVGAYFGTNSEEYARAVFYFSFVSKNITRPQLISFGRWANAATAPLIFGASEAQLLANWTGISTGDFTLQMGAYTFHLTGLNFTGASSLSNVASIIQSAIEAETGGGALWTGATVAWDSVNSRFTLTGGATGANTISVTAGSITDIAGLLGWLSPAAIFSNGVAVETITDTLTNSASLSNNFGCYTFTYAAALDLAQVTESATWNAAQGVKFQYYPNVTASNASAWSAALIGYAGTGLVLQGTTGQYHEMMPMCIMAATVYSNINSVQNYMFYQFTTLTPTVADDTDAALYDNLRINYLGQTQSAGVFVSFFQRGVLMGGATAPTDMNVYANEQWLADAAGTSAMNLLLALAQLPADTQGTNQLSIQLQAVVSQAKSNGTITTGKPFNSTQIIYITNATGDANAWRQVQSIGYWLNVVVESYVVNSLTQWKAKYTLIYSKDDIIRKVEGTDILI